MMKTTVCALALSCSLLGAAAAKAQTATADADKMFITNASQSDYTEIKFSQLALEKSSNEHIKAFAQKMITDHTALESQMKPFADKLGVTPVMQLDPDHQQQYDALSAMSSPMFEKTYMNDMGVDHHKAYAMFDQEKTSTADPALKKTVAGGEKVVAEHIKMADMIVRHMDKKMPATAPAGM